VSFLAREFKYEELKEDAKLEKKERRKKNFELSLISASTHDVPFT